VSKWQNLAPTCRDTADARYWTVWKNCGHPYHFKTAPGAPCPRAPRECRDCKDLGAEAPKPERKVQDQGTLL